jgi:hypothetical protein
MGDPLIVEQQLDTIGLGQVTQGRCGWPFAFAIWCAGKLRGFKANNVQNPSVGFAETMVTGAFGVTIGVAVPQRGPGVP